MSSGGGSGNTRIDRSTGGGGGELGVWLTSWADPKPTRRATATARFIFPGGGGDGGGGGGGGGDGGGGGGGGGGGWWWVVVVVVA